MFLKIENVVKSYDQIYSNLLPLILKNKRYFMLMILNFIHKLFISFLKVCGDFFKIKTKSINTMMLKSL